MDGYDYSNEMPAIDAVAVLQASLDRPSHGEGNTSNGSGDKRLQPPAEKVLLLRAKAKELTSQRLDSADALAQLRAYNTQIEGPCRDPELLTFLLQSKRSKISIDDLVKAGDTLSMQRQPFILDGIFIPQGTNLVVGREKKGKTSFVIAAIAAWHQGQPSFCDFDFCGDCPPVIIIGPDMPEQQWGKMLHMYGLADADGKLLPDGPIKLLMHMGHDFALDQHGLDLLDQIAEMHPSALFLFDSYSRLVSPLGLREETSEFAGPLITAQSILSRSEATSIWLHHSAANRDTGKASSRGSTALPAAADQIIFLESPTPNEEDPRTQLRTKGRDVSVAALLERIKPDGEWVCHASGEELERQRMLLSQISKLKGYAQDCFNALIALHSDNPSGADLRQIADAIGFDGQDNKDIDKVRKPMNRLLTMQLVSNHEVKHLGTQDGGRPAHLYRLLPKVQKALNLDSGNPYTREERQKPAKGPETCGVNGSDPLPRIQESDLSISIGSETLQSLGSCPEPSQLEVSGISSIPGMYREIPEPVLPDQDPHWGPPPAAEPSTEDTDPCPF